MKDTFRKNYIAERNTLWLIAAFLIGLAIILYLNSHPNDFGIAAIFSLCSLIPLGKWFFLRKEFLKAISASDGNSTSRSFENLENMASAKNRQIAAAAVPRDVEVIESAERTFMQMAMWGTVAGGLVMLIAFAFVQPVFGALLFIFAAPLFIGQFYVVRAGNEKELKRQLERVRSGVAATGIVLQRVKVRKGGTAVELLVSYRVEELTLLSGRLNRPMNYKMGMEVPIFLNPDDPKDFVLYDARGYGDCRVRIKGSLDGLEAGSGHRTDRPV